MNRKTTATAFLAILLALGLAYPEGRSDASDHIDFPGNEENPSGTTSAEDITDLFAFTNSEGRLVLIMDSLSDAGQDASFSEAIDYTFRLRRAQVTGGAVQTPGPADGGQEWRITCNYEAGAMSCVTEESCIGESCSNQPALRVENTVDALEGSATCAFDGGGTSCNTVYDGANTLRLFAGLRADPFYIDAIAAKAVLMPPGPERDGLRNAVGITELGQQIEGVMPRPGASDSLDGRNVLSIVLELDVEEVFGAGSSVFAVTAETYAAGSR